MPLSLSLYCFQTTSHTFASENIIYLTFTIVSYSSHMATLRRPFSEFLEISSIFYQLQWLTTTRLTTSAHIIHSDKSASCLLIFLKLHSWHTPSEALLPAHRVLLSWSCFTHLCDYNNIIGISGHNITNNLMIHRSIALLCH